MGRGKLAIALLALLAVAATVGACGSSSSSTAAQAEIERARQEGEAAAHERDQVSALKHRVEKLEHQGHPAAQAPPSSQSAGAPAAAATTTESAAPGVVFHTPSGNVACRVWVEGALCSVASADETFSLEGGEAAVVESGLEVETGAGGLAEYGSSFSEGSITCAVPPSNVPHGVTCSSSVSGHGFEASRIAARSRVY